MKSIEVVQYKWAGNWGPFKIKIACGECGASEGVIQHVIENEFTANGIEVSFVVLPWLNNWFKVILKGGWHAPVVLVNGKVISQGKVIDAGLLAAAIRNEVGEGYELKAHEKNVVFSKPGCPHCKKAKEILNKEEINFIEKNIASNPFAANQLFYLTKQFFHPKKPVTLPQIWLGGAYFGEATKVEEVSEKSTLGKYK